VKLLGSELRRLASRRMLFWIGLGLVGFVLTIVIINAATSDPASLDPHDAIRVTDLWLSNTASARLGVSSPNFIATIAVLTYMTVVVLGASAVGAEYRAGTVTTMLTWEPRRIRLLVARLGAVAMLSMALFLIIQLVFIGAWTIGVQAQGATSGADAGFWRELVLVVVRGTLLAGVLAVISAAFATLGRNTAAALGLWFGYLVAIEGIVRGQVSATIPWLLTSSAGAFYGWESVEINGHSVTSGAGALHLVIYVVLIGAAALVVFQRRDVT
jgi:ABC-type transport system involved in multi-copper enzyme maturation permease subunit